jgi:quinol monooxygenase YgiN
MIVEYIRYQIPFEQADEFLQAYGEAQQSLKASSHCLGYELSRCAEDAESFILRVEWDSADGHLKGFRTSPQFGPFFKPIQGFGRNLREMRHYDVSPVRWARSEDTTKT